MSISIYTNQGTMYPMKAISFPITIVSHRIFLHILSAQWRPFASIILTKVADNLRVSKALEFEDVFQARLGGA